MMVFQGFSSGPAVKKAEERPTLAVIRREYAETYAALQRLDVALAKGDIKGAQAITKGLTKWASETSRAVRSNYQLMGRIGGLEYNVDRLVAGTEANLDDTKFFGELTAERKGQVLEYIREGLSYAKENAIKAGSLSCLNEALSLKNAKISNEILGIMAGAQAPEDYLKIFGVDAKAGTPGFFTSRDVEFRNRKQVSIKPASDEDAPRFVEGSPLAQVDGMVKKGDFEGAGKIVEGKYLELARIPEIKLIKLELIEDVDDKAGLWETVKKGGELVVPGWGEVASGIRAYNDFSDRKYVLGTVNSVSCLLQLVMDIAAVISVGRLSRLTTKGKQAIQGLAKMAEGEFEKTVSTSVEKAINKELTKGIAKKTLEKLEDKEVASMYEKVLAGTKQAIIDNGGRGNFTKKSLQKTANEIANAQVESAIRITAANKEALNAEKVLAGGTGKRAGRISKTAREKVKGLVENAGKQLSPTSREASAAAKRARAGELREDGQKLMQEDYIAPYLAKAQYKPWKMFSWAGKHANRLTAKALEGQAWTLETSVSAQNWATRKFLGAKGSISPYFRSTPLVNVTKSNAYWWARATNVTGMIGTELPGSWADRKIGSPLQKAQDYLDGIAARKRGNASSQQAMPWQAEFDNVVNAMASANKGTQKDNEKRLQAYMIESGLVKKPDKEIAATLHRWAQSLPAELLKQQTLPVKKSAEPAKQQQAPAKKKTGQGDSRFDGS